MNKKIITKQLLAAFRSCPGNHLDNLPELGKASLAIFEEPIAGFGKAGDPLFVKYKEPGVIGPHFMTPGEWLPGAASVISFFFPFSEQVKKANAARTDHAAVEWAFARVEGQAFIAHCTALFADMLRDNGARVCVPSADERFSIYMNDFYSNWSERHAAYVCGLGTFGMSRGLITARGIAGRFASLITDIETEADARPYKDIYEYCIRCGACSTRCPAGAIPKDGLKVHPSCARFVSESGKILAPRYGCGLCQTGVPCESGIPCENEIPCERQI